MPFLNCNFYFGFSDVITNDFADDQQKLFMKSLGLDSLVENYGKFLFRISVTLLL